MQPHEIIRIARKSKRLTLEEVANYVGVSKNTISKYERGIITNIRRDKIEKLATILNVSPVSLITGSYEEKLIKKDKFIFKLAELLEKTDITDNQKTLIKNYVEAVLKWACLFLSKRT